MSPTSTHSIPFPNTHTHSHSHSPRRRSSSSSTSSTLSSLASPISSYTTSPTSPTFNKPTTLKHQESFMASYLSQQNNTPSWEWRWDGGGWQIKTKEREVEKRLDRLAEECMDEVMEMVRRDQEPWGR